MTLYGVSIPGIGVLTPEIEAELLLNRKVSTTSEPFTPTPQWASFVKGLFNEGLSAPKTVSELCEYTQLSQLDWGKLHSSYPSFQTTSQIVSARQKSIVNHLQLALGYPDEGSYFDEAMGDAKYEFRKDDGIRLVPKFMNKQFFPSGYDAIVANYYHSSNTDSVIGHVAWQKRVDDEHNWHLFSVYVQPDKRKQGLGVTLCERIVDAARESGVERIRFGELDQGYMRRVRDNFSQRESELGVKVADDMYVEVRDKPVSHNTFFN